MNVDELPQAIRLTRVAQLAGVHVATVFRWAHIGVRGRRLRTVMVGGRRAVLPSDLENFFQGDGLVVTRHEPILENPQPHRNAVENLRRLGVIPTEAKK